jgi:hypothetical protein
VAQALHWIFDFLNRPEHPTLHEQTEQGRRRDHDHGMLATTSLGPVSDSGSHQ